MTDLRAADFAMFVEEVHGRRPFPWQEDLVAEVLEQGSWPDVVDVPTGLGKTSTIDVAVFVAAATVDLPPERRPGRRRVCFVVDRRLVVDEAYEHAQRVAAALEAADSGSVTGRVAAALRRYAPSADRRHDGVPVERSPLTVTRMRGGVTWERDWLDRPDVPAVVVGTVDQLGSRLLFRGYGVSDRRAPIEAALVGADALVLVDEAHLAVAMISTLDQAVRRDASVLPLVRPTAVLLSATPRSGATRTFTLDLDRHRDHPVAGARLAAAKRLTTRLSDPKKVVDDLAAEAASAVAEGHAVLVVCNTVDRARRVHARLAKELSRGETKGVPVDLLVGRSRPVDRAALVERMLTPFRARSAEGGGRAPAVLVATQTVEVGVNLDADVLVTESAPWDSLVQRLGRLNRFGEAPEGAGRAVVVHDGEEDPVYGEPRLRCWELLEEHVAAAPAGIDVSPARCRELAPQFTRGEATARPVDAPLVTRAVLDSLARTSPRPANDVELAPYLHGLGREAASVQVAWRDGLRDLDEDLDLDADECTVMLTEVPVRADELVEVPLHAVRRWMRGETVGPVSDLESDEPTNVRVRTTREPFRALVHRPAQSGSGDADGRWTWVWADDVRPGDRLVVPTDVGGLDEYGWSPESTETVADVSEAARFSPGGEGERGPVSRRLLRLDAGLGRRLGLDDGAARELRSTLDRLVRVAVDGDDADDAGDLGEATGTPEERVAAVLLSAVRSVLSGAEDDAARPDGSAWTVAQLRELESWLVAGVRVAVVGERGGSDGVLFKAPPPVALLVSASAAADELVVREDETPAGSSAGTGRVPLSAHHANVGRRAADVCEALGLDEAVTRTVVTAARLHDAGKQEPRFQAMLCGGDALAADLLEEPLAKSGMDPRDKRAFRLARRRSGLPRGARHEVWSAQAVAAAAERLGGDVDVDLLVHLVLTHHGYGRSFPPVVPDASPRAFVVDVDGTDVKLPAETFVDLDQPERFARLCARYGRWGLALLESVVRTADMTISGEGS